MYSSRSAIFKIFPLFFVLILALPKVDEPGQSHSGKSLDAIIAQLLQIFPTHLREDEAFIDSHKGAVTQGLSQSLSAEYPRKNILIYHDQNATFEGANTIHRSIELPSDGDTPGKHTYEIQIFDSGTFTLASEDGYHNWAFAGNWSQRANVVKFYPLEESLAMYRSGREGAKLGGGYLPSFSGNTTDLETRDETIWSVSDDPNMAEVWRALRTGRLQSGLGIEASEVIVADEGGLLAAYVAMGPVADVVVAVIAAFAAVSLILVDVLLSLKHRNADERTFTQSTVAQIASAISDKNAIIYHNQDSSWSFVGWSHVHTEMNLHNIFKQTVGYEVYTFDYGNFSRHGDGGYENWAFFGNWYRDGDSADVIFFPRVDTGCTEFASMTPRALDSDKPKRIRHPLPPQIPYRQHADTTDGYYLVDCVKPDKTMALGIAYYRDMEVKGGNIGQLPDDFVEIHSNHAGVKAWQGEGSVLLSATGISFRWSFMHQDEQDDYATVGMAHTTTEQFWLYKDTEKLLFNSTMKWACSSSYFAF